MHKRTIGHALRLAFLAAFAAGAYFGFRGRGAEIVGALNDTSLPRLLVSYVLTVVGLLGSAAVWRNCLEAFGYDVPRGKGAAIFFVGQLGKYIPGSLWSIGAQAQMAASIGVPKTATAVAGLVALGYHVGSAVLVGLGIHALGGLTLPWPAWLSALGFVLGLIALLPPVVNKAGSIVARRPMAISWSVGIANLAWFAGLWACWTFALVTLLGNGNHPWLLAAAFGLSYAAGVLIVFAPAGLGPREALFIAMLSPAFGVAHAAALALLARVVHLVADITLAGLSWLGNRRSS